MAMYNGAINFYPTLNTWNDVWVCEICGKVRHDADIAVHTYKINSMLGAERNVKYCRDNADCFQGALKREDDENGPGPMLYPWTATTY